MNAIQTPSLGGAWTPVVSPSAAAEQHSPDVAAFLAHHEGRPRATQPVQLSAGEPLPPADVAAFLAHHA